MGESSKTVGNRVREIKLTQGKTALVNKDDFKRLSQYKWHYNSRGYATRQEYLGKVNGKYKQKTICMHREVNNTPVGKDTDHINGNKLDNRRENLRTCSRSQNVMNGLRTGKYTGVSFFHNKARNWKRYSARITVGQKTTFIGYYRTAEEAALAYNDVATKYHGEFARLNKVGG